MGSFEIFWSLDINSKVSRVVPGELYFASLSNDWQTRLSGITQQPNLSVPVQMSCPVHCN